MLLRDFHLPMAIQHFGLRTIKLHRKPAALHQPYFYLRDLIRHAVTRFNSEGLFFGHGSSNTYDDAAYLLLHSLKLPLDKLDPRLDAKLLSNEIESLLALVKRRCSERLPAAYLTNEAYLGDYRFYVDERVIVPRTFFAELTPEHFPPWIAASLRMRVFTRSRSKSLCRRSTL